MNGKRLGLGTVQWGVPYGVSNRSGKTTPDEVAAILSAAEEYGITLLDTAALYGDAESVLGKNRLDAFNIVTKTRQFGERYIEDRHVAEMVDTFNHSLQCMAVNSVYGLLVHNAQDVLIEGGGQLLAGMEHLKEQGKVSKIGVSIYEGSQLEGLLKKFTPDIVQLPLNVFDQRLIHVGWLKRLKDEGVEIHVRSVFLQGLLLMSLDDIPVYFDPIRPLLARWHGSARDQGMSTIQAALAFVRDLPEIDTVLIGVESLPQLQVCLDNFSNPLPFDAKGLACDDPAFVNPAFWRR